jgi:GMP synthase-like glutamine amidotransferase
MLGVMRRALILTHVTHEGPGRIAPALERVGLVPDVRRLYAGDALPKTLAEHAVLVVMGGPMGVSDVGSARYPFLAAELELLKDAVQKEFPVLGMCLGAQLLAAAAGAQVYPNVTGDPPRPAREVGWGAVHFVRTCARRPCSAKTRCTASAGASSACSFTSSSRRRTWARGSRQIETTWSAHSGPKVQHASRASLVGICPT